ncbi:hypothetical protein KII71_04420, partial [Helicobacter pylori]|nr:hypothetical protein [Helicobacter pylori]
KLLKNLKSFKKKQSLNLKKEILRYNVFVFIIFVVHGKLLFRIYPHNAYGGFILQQSFLKPIPIKNALKNH